MHNQTFNAKDEVIDNQYGWGVVQSGNDADGYEVGFGDILAPDEFPVHVLHRAVSELKPADQPKLEDDSECVLENLRTSYHDERAKAQEIGASYLDYSEPDNEHDNPHDVSLEDLGEIIYGGKPSALPTVTWDELSAELQGGLRQLVEGRHIDSDLEDALEALGLAEYVEYAHAVWATDAGRAILPPATPGDNMSVRQLLETIAEGRTGDYSAAAVASKALEKLNPQGFTAVIDPLAIDTEGAYMNPQSAAEHWKALHESGVEAHAETLERVKVLEAENARLRDVMIEALAFARTGLIPMEFEPYVFDGETRRLHWNEHMRIQIAKLIDAALK